MTLRFHDLPLFGKFLLPFLGLVVLLGTLGTFFVVRDLSERAEAELHDTLSRTSLETRSLLRDRELYLVESANFSANLAGLATSVQERDAEEATRLLHSVIALKRELGLLVAADPDGHGFLTFLPRERGADVVPVQADWNSFGFVREALAHPRGAKFAGLVSVAGRTFLAVAGAICSDAQGCAPAGVAIVGLDVERVAAAVAPAAGGDIGVALYDGDGRLLASSGGRVPGDVPPLPASRLLRRIDTHDGVETAEVFAEWEVRGERIGTVAVAVPTAPAFASVQGAGVRLALLVVAGMAGIVVLGALISRLTTSRVTELLETSRALGRGELSVRAPVLGRDELGELAQGVNQMAEELQASRETLELRVRQRTEEVERLMRERNEIFASLSHELRTPLAAILLESEMLLDAGADGQWTDEAGATIHDSAQQLLSLVNDILELARAEAGKIEVRLEAVDVGELTEELRPTIEGLARSAELTLAVDVPGSLPAVRADRRRLREVIVNLVDNAVKYTPAGGAVTVEAGTKDDVVWLAVTDTGVGMPQDATERIFEPFYRVPGSRPQRGQASSGLGLALSRRLVEAQGGQIGVSSRSGEGSRFVLTLPVMPAPATHRGPAARPSGRRRQPVPARSR